MSKIIILLIIIIMLMPDSEITVSTKFFTFRYSRERLFRRHKKAFESLSGKNKAI